MTNGTNKLNFKESTAMATSSMHEAESFCSAEDFLDNEPHSPTDSSEDSVEVKISAITFNHKKRKLIIGDNRKEFSGPLKKRMCLKVKADEEKESAKLNNRNKLRGNEEITPFRPWSPPKNGSTNFAVPHQPSSSSLSSVKLESSSSGAFAYFRPPSPQQRNNNNNDDQPVSLVVKREDLLEEKIIKDIRVPVHPEITTLTAAETERMILKTNEQFPGLNNNNSNNNMSSSSSSTTSTSFNPLNNKKQDATTKREQRNYKNMTRERRIEANARERTRVHTISAAFDTLRHAVPAYSHNQKLSKLSVLRIACSYIMTLSSLVHDDDDDDNEEIISNNNMEPSTAECVDLVSKTIQKEGKLRKKKDDND